MSNSALHWGSVWWLGLEGDYGRGISCDIGLKVQGLNYPPELQVRHWPKGCGISIVVVEAVNALEVFTRCWPDNGTVDI